MTDIQTINPVGQPHLDRQPPSTTLRPSDEVQAKQDPDHAEHDFTRDLRKATRRVERDS
jgi:hypothetical protein